jgi:glycosyltransferase involved in cell wall biosynthesis
MKPLPKKSEGRFVVATPGRSVCDDNAQVLARLGHLRFLALGTRRGTAGVPPERTRLLPAFGLAAYAAAKLLSPHRAESFSFRLHPWFDRWVKKQLTPSDHILSSYGYANASFQWVRAHGGKTFLDGGNSHPENFWQILTEEHRRWNCPTPPVGRHHYERSLAMMEHVDYVLSPSSFVTRSFLEHGFRPDQILRNVYPVDLSCFAPASGLRPVSRPLTLINTGSLSLRKGTPYLLEAFRLVRKKIPDVRLLLTESVQDDVKPILARYHDLPIEWSGYLPHEKLVKRLQSADIFVLPSLEEGLARTACQALASGLPAILTPNTGVNDFIQPGLNGEVVPIRDPQAIADAVFKWADIIMTSGYQPQVLVDEQRLSFAHFEARFIGQLRTLKLV